MLKLNSIQNQIIDRRNGTIQALEERLEEEKEYLAAYIRTIPRVSLSNFEKEKII